jgi:hypothetical protein
MLSIIKQESDALRCCVRAAVASGFQMVVERQSQNVGFDVIKGGEKWIEF